jgi:GT2 family glycosyltransferase
MVIDVIILSNGKTDELKEITQQSIDTCHSSEEDHTFNIVVYEQQPFIKYKGALTVHYVEDFHYNRLMNRGIKETNNEWICLANNDLVFHKGWLTECLKHDYLSMSPNDKPGEGIEEGYTISYDGQVKGWCILTQRKLYDIIGKIDESVSFWYSDNVYADQLKEHNIKHALIKKAYVEHLDSKTLKTTTEEERLELCDKQKEKYSQKMTLPKWEIN